MASFPHRSYKIVYSPLRTGRYSDCRKCPSLFGLIYRLAIQCKRGNGGMIFVMSVLFLRCFFFLTFWRWTLTPPLGAWQSRSNQNEDMKVSISVESDQTHPLNLHIPHIPHVVGSPNILTHILRHDNIFASNALNYGFKKSCDGICTGSLY